MSMLDRILAAVNKLQADLNIITLTLLAQGDQLQVNSQKLDRILSILLEPAPIAGAVITLGDSMKPKAPKKASVDFQLLDSGTATGTISFVDSVGEPTTLQSGATVSTTVTSSDPDLSPTVDSTGLIISITVTLATPPPPLPILDIVISASISVSNPDGTTLSLTAASEGIDLVAGGPAGASISLS